MARKSFDIPDQYRSPVIRQVKEATKILDPTKKDLTPTLVGFWPLYSFTSPDFLAFVME
jgi:4-hydroxy-3-methylbut-2-enyl diphosphate reductase